MKANKPYNPPHYPTLIVISGPSGVGKDTIAQLLLNGEQENFHFVVTATTRPPRKGEVDGVDYYFVSHDEFARMIEEDELLEYAIVYNDYKGIPKQQIREALASGKDVIMRLDIQGAETIRQLIPNSISIFLTAESEEALVQRLRERKSETAEGLALRTAMARQEMKGLGKFDFCVVNKQGRQEETVRKILAIIQTQHCRTNQTVIVL